MTYVPGFLERNGYIHGFDTLSSETQWRFALNDKGLLALRRPSLSDPEKTTYERIKEAASSGVWNISHGTAANLISAVLLGGAF